MSRTIAYEQAVYGSFPFWNKGYAVLGQSAGCQPEWLDALRLAAQRYGERPPGVAENSALFALRMSYGLWPSRRTWMVVGVFPQGCDDQGRPGALAFHAVFVGPWAYRRIGADPFLFASVLRGNWTAVDREARLPVGRLAQLDLQHAPAVEPDEGLRRRAESIAMAIEQRERVEISADGPIEELARAVWRALSGPARRRTSVATWAFRNDNQFSLVALPRQSGMLFEPADPATEDEAEPRAIKGGRRGMVHGSSGGIKGLGWRRLAVGFAAVSGLILFTFVAVIFSERWTQPRSSPDGPTSVEAVAPIPLPRSTTPPAKSDEPPLSPEEVRRMTEALAGLVDRFSPLTEDQVNCSARGQVDGQGGLESTRLMIRLGSLVRYHGRLLGPDECESLRISAREAANHPSPEPELALKWHTLVTRFAPDHPLPADFKAGPARWQLATLAWSFHVNEDPALARAIQRGEPEEIVHTLADLLMVDVPLPRSSLSSLFPQLDDYRKFLGGLPRK